MTAAENIKVNDEIAAFCASTSHPPSAPSHQHEPQDLLTIDQIVPEPSISDSSLKHPPSVKKEKKRCKFISLYSPTHTFYLTTPFFFKSLSIFGIYET